MEISNRFFFSCWQMIPLFSLLLPSPSSPFSTMDITFSSPSSLRSKSAETFCQRAEKDGEKPLFLFFPDWEEIVFPPPLESLPVLSRAPPIRLPLRTDNKVFMQPVVKATLSREASLYPFPLRLTAADSLPSFFPSPSL